MSGIILLYSKTVINSRISLNRHVFFLEASPLSSAERHDSAALSITLTPQLQSLRLNLLLCLLLDFSRGHCPVTGMSWDRGNLFARTLREICTASYLELWRTSEQVWHSYLQHTEDWTELKTEIMRAEVQRVQETVTQTFTIKRHSDYFITYSIEASEYKATSSRLPSKGSLQSDKWP